MPLAVTADVAQAGDVERLSGRAIERFGRLDVLVNNAGVYLTAPVVEMTDADWDLTIDVDLKGVFLCSRAAGRQMTKQRDGRIINVTSIAQVRGGTPGHAHYGAAKARHTSPRSRSDGSARWRTSWRRCGCWRRVAPPASRARR